MKKYTILEALKEIERLFPLFNFDNMEAIAYYKPLINKYQFIATFGKHKTLIDLDAETYQLIE